MHVQQGPLPIVGTIQQNPVNALNSSIPVVDLSKFEYTSTRNEFLRELEAGLKVGFFAIINSEIDIEAVKTGYEAFNKFFASSKEKKATTEAPETHGQRGYIPGGETGLGSSVVDSKEIFHVGRSGNKWPPYMNLKEPAKQLYKAMDSIRRPILNAISLLLGQSEDFLTSQTNGNNNLMRSLHYRKNPETGVWAAAHTDIDLGTILPYASEEGLEIEIDGKWVPVCVPENALIFNVGDMLESFSNGAWPSCNHRVRCTKEDTDRESIVYFIHPTDESVIKPLGEGTPKYPEGTRLEYLFLRLFSLGLLSGEAKEGVIEGKFIKRINSMVEDNQAAEAVVRWRNGFIKTLEAEKKKNETVTEVV